jgi:hypothetical protein
MTKCFYLLFICLITFSSSDAQVYFQFEQANSLKVKKYGIGDVLSYQTSKYPGVWQEGEIIDINVERQSVVFIDRVSYLNEMTYIKYNRPWAYGVGTSLFVFGTSWLVFGGAIEGLRSIGAIETNYTFGWDTAIIGGTAMASGYLTRALWGTAVKKLNEKKRVRIIDLRL